MEQQPPRGLCSVASSQYASGGAGVSTGQPSMRLCITSTTGSPVELTVPRGETAEALKARISQKLRLHTDRIVLLHKDRAERTVVDVLESLSEVQISDFLSGHSPLNINLGIGAHVMCVELQLSAQDVKELQQDSKARTSGEHQTDTQTASSMNHLHSASARTSTTKPTTSPSSQTSSVAPDSVYSLSSNQFSTQGASMNSAANPSDSFSSIPAMTRHNPTFLLNSHSELTSPNAPTSPSVPCGSPHPSCPLQATAAVCSAHPINSSPAPLSPTAASTFTERNVNASAAPEPSKPPGAVIESFVRHSPGIFSGTFSGTLAPCSQNGFSHPRRGVAIILQILNDLLRAAYHHQGAPSSLPPHHCPAPQPAVSPMLTAEEPTSPVMQRTEHVRIPPGDESPMMHSSTEENQTLHCKLEHLQLLMHERRLRRRARKTHLSQGSHPYQNRHHHP